MIILTKVDIEIMIPNKVIPVWVFMNNHLNYIRKPQITHNEFTDFKYALKYHGLKRKTPWQKVKRKK